ncbi:hypothetical protein BV20DRAFT_993664 [Pilatotrama ljubarskyi]|nr:hypothetical protein BV20DRAFT_993664 [Pilatotrama ljubarskyi]
MFRFNFDVDEAEDSVARAFNAVPSGSSGASARSHQQNAVQEDPSREIPLESLLSALPHTFSFSPLAVPLTSKRDVVLSRRDLFDARFQVIASDEDTHPRNGRSDLDFLDAPSDLVPGVYEGGLKTWECSLDLVDCLDSIYNTEVAEKLQGKRILELGCGTAVPSLYLLQAIFSKEPSANSDIHIHLQDYNELVLRLVTLPNVILAWYMSRASATFRSYASTTRRDKPDDPDVEPEPLPQVDTTEPGELPVTPALTAAFVESLRRYGVHLKFFCGSWSSFDVGKAGGPYHIILTSETIYRQDCLGPLVDLMHRATALPPSAPQEGPASLADSTARLSITDEASLRNLADAPYLCIVAAKVVYFGVGGGVSEFVRAVEGHRPRGTVRTIWERIHGVKRSVMQVLWHPA